MNERYSQPLKREQKLARRRTTSIARRCLLASLLVSSAPVVVAQRPHDRGPSFAPLEIRLSNPRTSRGDDAVQAGAAITESFSPSYYPGRETFAAAGDASGQRQIAKPIFVVGSPAPRKLSDLVGDLVEDESVASAESVESPEPAGQLADVDFGMIWNPPLTAAASSPPPHGRGLSRKEAAENQVVKNRQMVENQTINVVLPPARPASPPRFLGPRPTQSSPVSEPPPSSELRPSSELLPLSQPTLGSLPERLPKPDRVVVAAEIFDRPPTASPRQVEIPERSAEISAAASRLRSMARSSMLEGRRLLDRGAIFSAHEATTRSLRQIVQSVDLANISNQSTASLTAALRAIKESKDFSSIYGIDDPGSLGRMVASHQTKVLQGVDLERLLSFAATAMYLQAAEDHLVEALGDYAESGDALILLGRIEQMIAPEDTTYHGAVALAMHSAAARIRPHSAMIHRELGITMLHQGMDRLAAQSLRQSISMRASRRGYRYLQQASARLGDQDTVRQCQYALGSAELQSDAPVKHLEPLAFANTGPAIHSSNPTGAPATAAAPGAEKKKTASKWFPFLR